MLQSTVLAALLVSGAVGLQAAVSSHDRTMRSMNYSAGIHLIKLPDIKRQFLLSVPQELAQSPDGVPLVVVYHGFSDSPWYTNAATSITTELDRYGWLGIFPFGLNEKKDNGLGGILACCPPGCDEECCKNGRHLSKKDESACRWSPGGEDEDFTEALVHWAKENTVMDPTKVFAAGFSNGGMYANALYCTKAHLFRAVAPISGDLMLPGCTPSRPISYLSMCGSADDEAFCQNGARDTAAQISKLSQCTGQGPLGEPILEKMSATTTCMQWSNCKDGNFVESCMSEGLAHDVSGHLRPDDISYIRPGSDLDITEYMFQKFSLLAGTSVLFYGHPTDAELNLKQSAWPPPTHEDHLYLRRGRLLGKDEIA